MFGLFGKKTPATVLDKLIFAMYGNPPPPKRANVDQAIALAANDLLMAKVDGKDVRQHALNLSSGPIPYSTHDLAIATALYFFKQPHLIPHFDNSQLMARLTAAKWLREGLAAPVLIESFENTLYTIYKPR